MVDLEFEPATGEPRSPKKPATARNGRTPKGCVGTRTMALGCCSTGTAWATGQHTVRAYADDEEFAHSTFNVTTLGEDFVEDLARTHAIEDFPAAGQTTTVEWQQGQQNFVIIGVE